MLSPSAAIIMSLCDINELGGDCKPITDGICDFSPEHAISKSNFKTAFRDSL